MAKMRMPAEAIGQDDFVSSATQLHDFGWRAETDDGRVFRYCKAGAADLVAGNVIQGPAIVTTHLANTPPAVAAGATSFTYTPGGTLGTLNQYANGYLQVDTTPGNGFCYVVSGHPAFALSTAFTLTLKDPIQVALTTSSRVGLIANPYNGVIQAPQTTATGIIVGVAGYVITANQFGWLQTWGMASVLINGTPALGAHVLGISATTAGSVDIETAAPLIVSQRIGVMAQIGVSTKNNFVYLKIAP
jgi:hypothetical protein